MDDVDSIFFLDVFLDLTKTSYFSKVNAQTLYENLMNEMRNPLRQSDIFLPEENSD